MKSHLSASRVYPAFDEKMGKRFRTARINHCKKHWSNKDNIHPANIKDPCTCLKQRVVAKLLGVSQNSISMLERGLLKKAPFTEAALRSVFHENSDFILTGVGAEDYCGFKHRRVRTYDIIFYD